MVWVAAWQRAAGADVTKMKSLVTNVGEVTFVRPEQIGHAATVRLQDALRCQVRVVDLFHHPTVSALAAHLARGSDDDSAVVEGRKRSGVRRVAEARLLAQPRRQKITGV